MSPDKYIDNNNFIQINNFRVNDDRFSLSESKEFRFYDYTINPPWVGD